MDEVVKAAAARSSRGLAHESPLTQHCGVSKAPQPALLPTGLAQGHRAFTLTQNDGSAVVCNLVLVGVLVRCAVLVVRTSLEIAHGAQADSILRRSHSRCATTCDLGAGRVAGIDLRSISMSTPCYSWRMLPAARSTRHGHLQPLCCGYVLTRTHGRCTLIVYT